MRLHPPLSLLLAAALVAAGAAGAAEAAGAQAAEPPRATEAQVYLDSLEKAGMSEMARGALLTVSSVVARESLLSFEKEGDVYLTQYESRFCGVPGKETRPEVVAAEKGVDALVPLADLDGSGWVSSEEATRFQKLFELGRALPYVAAEEKTADALVLARALRLTPGDLARAYADYPALAARSRDLFPPLPALQGLPAVPAAPRPAASKEKRADFRALAAQVQASEMSESARRYLLSLADFQNGTAQWILRKDPQSGLYTSVEYRVIEKDPARRSAQAEPRLPGLRRLADFDGSGFVTTAEAARLRNLLLFGRRLAFVTREEKTADGPTVARLLGLKPEPLQAQLADYARLAERAPADLLAPLPALQF